MHSLALQEGERIPCFYLGVIYVSWKVEEIKAYRNESVRTRRVR